MCSPTRIAFAMAVSAGFTAPMLGKKLVSTTYRLSSSWALQSTSSTEVAASVLDVNCRAHQVDNLYVVDTSFFPSIGAVNPALTAMANAIRVGDHLLARMGATSTAAPAVEGR